MPIFRWRILVAATAIFLTLVFLFRSPSSLYPSPPSYAPPETMGENGVSSPKKEYYWAKVPTRYPVKTMKVMPTGIPGSIPRIQAKFKSETATQKAVRLERLDAVKSNFTHAWAGYKKHAWLRDEVRPLSGVGLDPFGGWAATLVDSLDTLWIMGLKDEFREAVEAIEKIDFTNCALKEINVFETTIRYLGGFLAANDLCGGEYPGLIKKAIEVGDMLYVAFDTPNRMPITRWNLQKAADGELQVASGFMLVSEIGSLTLEFTRLSQVTGDPRYFDAVQRIMDIFDAQQAMTKLPGMWPVVVDAKRQNFTEHEDFTIGGMADSLYEYLPKQHILLGGGTKQYQKLYEDSMVPMKRHIFYQPMTPDNRDMLFAGQVKTDNKTPLSELVTEPQAQHLGCFAGGMVGLAAKIFNKDEDLKLARRLVEGCLWAYENGPQGVMSEIIHTVACPTQDGCEWDEKRWLDRVGKEYQREDDPKFVVKQLHLPQGVSKIDDKRYILRPEAIESIFILYRLTGDTTLMDRAWNMFITIVKLTKTDIGHAALDDCTANPPPKADRTESFWFAETLKYFYLIFAETDLISLDEWVLNTEAHPLKRPA